jgi:hypothetical protein
MSQVIQLLRKETFCADGVGWSIRERDIFHILVRQLKRKTRITENDYSSSWKWNEGGRCVSGQGNVFIPTSLVFAPSHEWSRGPDAMQFQGPLVTTLGPYFVAPDTQRTDMDCRSRSLYRFGRMMWGVNILTICKRNTTHRVFLWFFFYGIDDRLIYM